MPARVIQPAIAMLLLSACSYATCTSFPLLSEASLANQTCSGIYDTPVTLVDGIYWGAPYVASGAERPTLEYLGSARHGGLNDDGIDDAVVFLVARGGGTGAFVYVSAQLNHGGEPLDAGAMRIEDRIQVLSAKIADGVITLDVTAEGPGDAACCRTHKRTQRCTLEADRLVELHSGSSPALERISFADLEGRWTLVELDYDTPLTSTEITALFEAGQIRGNSGCNSYSSPVVLDRLPRPSAPSRQREWPVTSLYTARAATTFQRWIEWCSGVLSSAAWPSITRMTKNCQRAYCVTPAPISASIALACRQRVLKRFAPPGRAPIPPLTATGVKSLHPL